MATLSPSPVLPAASVRQRGLPVRVAAAIAATLAAVGVGSIWGTVAALWFLWTTDALKSIGMVIPLVSFLLILRAWRSLGWRMDGTWWGFALLVLTAALVRVRDQSIMVLVLAPQWSVFFPPHSAVFFAYGLGAVLLFGGWRLARACVFPLALLLLVNPIPHIFNVLVDLPLQRASAHVARAFAQALGQPLSPDKLRLMFTPEFGMFIAPGCNGIRGAVTMGLIALVTGYLYRFRWKTLTGVVIAAVLLGYVFNFVRLCVLVLYYLLALHLPQLQKHAENADYVIGAGLFFLAVYLLYTAIEHLRPATEPGAAPGVSSSPLRLPVQPEAAPAGAEAPGSFWPRAAAMLALCLVGCIMVAHAYAARPAADPALADMRVGGTFPESIGTYTRVRVWNESFPWGALLFRWAEYAPAAGGTHVSLGISPVLGSHDTLLCHTARGEAPLWHGEQSFATAAGAVAFSDSFFNDGATQYLEATTLCSGNNCGEFSSPSNHLGFVWSKPDSQSLWRLQSGRPIPILIRAETIDTTKPATAARAELTADVQSFLRQANLRGITEPYRR